MIRRVKIQGYKSLKDVELRLRPLTVVIGPNAAGKSNLFDALGLLSRMVTKRTLKEAFDEHRGAPLEAFHIAEGGVGSLLQKEQVQFSMEVDVELSQDAVDSAEHLIGDMRKGLPVKVTRHRVIERLLRYSLTVELVTRQGHLRVVDESLAALRKDGREQGSRNRFIEKVEDRLHLRLEGKQAHPIYHDIGLDYTLASVPLYAPHYPHITAFREEAARWQFFYFDPVVMRQETSLKEVKGIGSYGNDLAAFYHTLKCNDPKQFDVLQRSLAQLLPAAYKLETELTPEGYVRLKLQENGVEYSSRVISEGTLRLLGLLAIVHPGSSATTIGFEEPENGVHPRRLELMARLFTTISEGRRKQIIVNTHSPILPEYFKEDSLIVCQRRGRETVFETFPVPSGLFKRQDIESALEEKPEEETSLTERILRGDFGG